MRTIEFVRVGDHGLTFINNITKFYSIASVIIELPEEVVLLLEKDEILKYIIKESPKDLISKYLLAEELTEGIYISEEDILEIDEKIKEKA